MTPADERYYRALTIAGSDSGGGAGIQADLKTFGALGCYGLSVITALTAQNTRTVAGINAVPPSFVAQQLRVVLEDIGADAIKTGMLHDSAVISAVADVLREYKCQRLVVDPVMIAKSGDCLLQPDAVRAMRELLLPIAAVITPNLPEAEVLLNRRIESEEEMRRAARDLAQEGAAVVVKGGHLGAEDCMDCLYIAREDRYCSFTSPRIDSGNTHGTGCTFSAAVTAFLARGLPVEQAVGRAKRYLQAALEAGARFKLGCGHGPVHHFHEFWGRHEG